MTSKTLISVILTSYNDCQIIRPFYEAILKILKDQVQYDWELVYVDDGSTDGSVQELKQLTREDTKVSLIEFSRNFGQQKAFFAGMRQAKGDVIITLDGDFQYAPQCIIQLTDKLMEGYDLVSGIRIRRKDSLFSRITSVIGQYFVRRSLQHPVKDFGSVKAFSRFLTDQIITFEHYCTMPYGMAFALTNRIDELPVIHLLRHSGKSKWNFTKRLHVYIDLFLAYSPYETTNMIRIGGGLILIGFSTLVALLYIYLVNDMFLFHTFRAAVALFLIGGGLVLIFGAIFFSFFLRIYRQLFWKGSCYVIRKTYPP